MTTTPQQQFERELGTFFRVALLNLAFGALAMAFGLQYIVASVLGVVTVSPGFRPVTAALALTGFGLGLAWILASARILRGIREIRREFRQWTGPVPAERLTCWIVRLMAHYRENRGTVQYMILMCTAGGICFFLLGIGAGADYISITAGGMAFSMSSLRILPAMVLTFGIAAVSLYSSYFFDRYAALYDRRLAEIDRAGQCLKTSLGQDRP